MNPINNNENQFLPYLNEYTDNPSSLQAKQHNIEIVNNLVHKIKMSCSHPDTNEISFKDLKLASSQNLKNKILEAVSIKILENKDFGISCNFLKIMDKLLTIEAEITDKAHQQLFAAYQKHIIKAKTDQINRKQYHITTADEISCYLKPSSIFINELEAQRATIDNLGKHIIDLKTQISNLQQQTTKVDKKITRLSESKSCCVIC